MWRPFDTADKYRYLEFRPFWNSEFCSLLFAFDCTDSIYNNILYIREYHKKNGVWNISKKLYQIYYSYCITGERPLMTMSRWFTWSERGDGCLEPFSALLTYLEQSLKYSCMEEKTSKWRDLTCLLPKHRLVLNAKIQRAWYVCYKHGKLCFNQTVNTVILCNLICCNQSSYVVNLKTSNGA